VALPVAAFIELLAKSVASRANTATSLDVFNVGWVRIRPSQGAAAEMLPKMTHDPAYFS